MTITAKIIADSISEEGVRLTTMQLSFPRFILPEFNTHRAFSRSARSSRAVPTAKLIEEVRKNPVMPIEWRKNIPGMQAGEEMSEKDAREASVVWKKAACAAADFAAHLTKLGLHKQWAARVIEPYLPVHVVVTATDYANFFALRCHPDAQPEIQALAREMYRAQSESKPDLLRHGEWHLPYVTGDDEVEAWARVGSENEAMSLLCRISSARCARVSYNRHDGQAPSVEDDLKLFDRLAGSQPIHASPMEHQATPDIMLHAVNGGAQAQWLCPELHGNLRGWRQFRKMIPGNTIDRYELESGYAA